MHFAMKGLGIFGGSRYTVPVTERNQRNCATDACAICMYEVKFGLFSQSEITENECTFLLIEHSK